ncbi:MAG: DUF4062 domain-containing protein [Kiritimatiellaeota bacterium]|nr:DUF4062 domain-containing protein [Kiritimatiellota bacterium]
MEFRKKNRMSYHAIAIQVMIASPSDVATERRIAAEVIHEWNAINSEERRVVLMPLAWETHAAPAMGDRPQGIINKQVTEKADLLIGIFWTRIGTPTGTSESGTVEEIEEHIKAGKPTMLYFSGAPVVPDSIDAEQYKMLTDFREKCRKGGLVETYDDLAAFRAKLTRQLAITIKQDKYLAQVLEVIPESGATLPPSMTATGRKVVVPDLSREAQILIVEAAQDPNGSVLTLRHMQGSVVQTNGKNFVPDNNPRSAALWHAALEQLQACDLVEARGYKGEVFAVTHLGYEVADVLKDLIKYEFQQPPAN